MQSWSRDRFDVCLLLPCGKRRTSRAVSCASGAFGRSLSLGELDQRQNDGG